MPADDLDRWIRDLDRAGERALKETRGVVSKGALNVKNEWRDNARQTAPRHAPHYPDSITYDLETNREHMAVEAEIGPDKNKTQGALGNLLEYGSRNNPPHNDGGRAMQNEEPRFENAMGDVGERVLQE